ncbi:hypothetical protein [Streptomyces sp. NPDC058086]|uniref:hypothetical protein n=1 Tax=Streptomyces sp. NPDC058086 TaxID=3346334 RepID=UPI0036F06CDE
MRQPDADTNGRNLWFVLVADPGGGRAGRRGPRGRNRRHPSEGRRHIGVFLTDLPSRMERNPVSTEVEPEHRVALISLPALGTRRLRRRVRQAVVGVVRQQAAQDEEPARRRPSGTAGGRGLAWVGFVDALDAQGL